MNLRTLRFLQSLCTTLASTSNTMNGVKSKAIRKVNYYVFLIHVVQTHCETWRKSKGYGVDDAFRFKCPLSCPALRPTTRKSAMGNNLNLHECNQVDFTIPCATLLKILHVTLITPRLGYLFLRYRPMKTVVRQIPTVRQLHRIPSKHGVACVISYS